jgi:ribosomal protein S4
MRKFSKYKKFSSSGAGVVRKVPLSILKLRRPKWLFLQKTLTRRSTKRKTLINPFIIKSSFKSWEKVKRYYKKGLQNKNVLRSIYDSSIKFKTLEKKIFSKSLKKKDIISHYLIEPQYKLDVLLWNLYFFSSIYEARQEISNKQVLVNGHSSKSNTLLKKGDVVTFKRTQESLLEKNDLFFKKCVQKYSITEKFITFLEVDYSTKTIVIIKNFEELSQEDIYILITDFIPLKSLHYNI